MSARVQLSPVEARAVVAAGAYRAHHGAGPGWAWLRSRLGLSRRELDQLLRDLRRRGLVSFSPQPGSLTVDPAAARQAVAIVRDQAARHRNAGALEHRAGIAERGRRRSAGGAAE